MQAIVSQPAPDDWLELNKWNHDWFSAKKEAIGGPQDELWLKRAGCIDRFYRWGCVAQLRPYAASSPNQWLLVASWKNTCCLLAYCWRRSVVMICDSHNHDSEAILIAPCSSHGSDGKKHEKKTKTTTVKHTNNKLEEHNFQHKLE